jgi:hypothetical protein
VTLAELGFHGKEMRDCAVQVLVSRVDPLVDVGLMRVVQREFGTMELLGGDIPDLHRLLIGGQHGDHLDE